MKAMEQSVKNVIDTYPAESRAALLKVRALIYEVAAEIDTVNGLTETLKWGEPSYVLKGGSTIRIAWKASIPDSIGIYFNCQTQLIDTFRALFDDVLTFEGNRAIVLDNRSDMPVEIIRQCLLAALTYHKRKQHPLLGM